MQELIMRIRSIGGIAVLAVGPNAVGDTVLPGDNLASRCVGSRGVAFDLAGYDDVIDSELIGCLIRARQTALSSGLHFRLCCPNELLRHVMSVTALDRMMSVFASLAETLADFDLPPG
jgi:anti-anti-sigma regulatory factor